MKRALLIGCLLLVVWGVVAVAGPEMTVEQPNYNFGSIGQGYMVKHTFVLQNTGDQTLEIAYIHASCGCTTTELSTNRLAPGESVPLEVLVLADKGTVKNVSIDVYTNAPDTHGRLNEDRMDPDITLKVRGAITPKQGYETAPFELGADLIFLIDVRDADSYAVNHLIGAINMPADELATRMASLPRSALIIVYDLAGEAADEAVQMLVNARYMSAYYLQGGLSRWVDIQGDQYLLHATPLPATSGNVLGGSSGRPYNQGTLRSKFYVLIDLRDADSYAAGHLAGAMNIPSEQLSQWFDRIPREAKVILYDDDGSIAVAAYQGLLNAGFTRSSVLLGGLNEWIYQYGYQYVMSE